MATLRVPMGGRKIMRRTSPVQKSIRGFQTAIADMPLMSKRTGKKSLRRQIARPLDRLSKKQQTLALGAAFIALDALIAGIVISYVRRRKAAREDEAMTELGVHNEAPNGIVTETIVEDFERTILTQ
ncbi:MAG TPA: hypothetical protein VKQ30_05160 [Ktedonobacterales bacterium]|nr:hypothetical protein [Ktedonobacterales bacterium]